MTIRYTVHRYFAPCENGQHQDCAIKAVQVADEDKSVVITSHCCCICHVLSKVRIILFN